MTESENAANLDSVKQKLDRVVASFKPIVRSKIENLLPLKDQIIQLKKKGASNAVVAGFITQSGMKVSGDTVMRFLHVHGIKKRKTRKIRRRGNGNLALQKGAQGQT
jgi:hypothetical protein